MTGASMQSLYNYDPRNSHWSPRISEQIPPISSCNFATFSVLTWNIDFAAPGPIIRIQTLLNYIEQLLSPPVDPQPTIILLQELHRLCFPALLSHNFVRKMYDTTDISPSSWSRGSPYGTVTLVPKSVSAYVSSVFRTPFLNSGMGRDALYIDLDLPSQAATSDSNTKIPKTKVRIANTHLESLRDGDGARPAQLGSVAESLASSGIRGGLVAGDMNAISPSDVGLPERVGLMDPWEELASGVDRDGKGHTWGYQPHTVYPPSRLDKVLLKGDLRVRAMKKIGIGLKVTGQDGWVSDHYGLLAKVVLQS